MIHELLRSSGSPIPSETRDLLEARFGCDFSAVRLHFGERAAQSARRLKADAYTAGEDIVIREAYCDFQRPKGLWLLAHELVHVIQQRGGSGVWQGSGSGYKSLEPEANRAADLIAGGRTLPTGFPIASTCFGAIQCHQDEPCPGTRVSASDQSVYMPANQAIELAYKADPRFIGHANAVLVGSDFDRMANDILLPAGAPDRRLANEIIRQLRGISRQLRPDIIDFVERAIYEIKSTNFVQEGVRQVQGYYARVDSITRGEMRTPPWRMENANWYPPHVLPLGGATKTRIVCTQATEYTVHPALILYEVRELDDDEQKKRRMRQAVRFEVGDFDQAFEKYWPGMRNELRRAIRMYDPENPEYVIIVPEDFYRARWAQYNDEMLDKFVRVKPGYDFPGGQALQAFKHKLFIAEMIIAGVAAVAIVIAASAVLVEVIPAGVAAGTSAAAGGGAAAAGGDVVSLAAYRAALASPAVRTVAKAAGVLFILGVVRNANAAPSVDKAAAIRAVAVADFQIAGGTPVAATVPQTSKLFGAVGTCSAGFPKEFAMGKRVLFDGQPHYVIAQLSAK